MTPIFTLWASAALALGGAFPEAPGPVTELIQTRFFGAVRGENEKYRHWLSPVSL